MTLSARRDSLAGSYVIRFVFLQAKFCATIVLVLPEMAPDMLILFCPPPEEGVLSVDDLKKGCGSLLGVHQASRRLRWLWGVCLYIF